MKKLMLYIGNTMNYNLELLSSLFLVICYYICRELTPPRVPEGVPLALDQMFQVKRFEIIPVITLKIGNTTLPLTQ